MTDEKDKALKAHQSIIDPFPIMFNAMISLQQQSIFKPIYYYLWGVKEAVDIAHRIVSERKAYLKASA
ncbi:hypothetical protein O0I10_003717 [Lichtheimia ornata]|uniref:Uncharacterized protein n=1 Tax=Lichtheimia ornata TaxID=688661 RepID=A0AAD7V787_9FUNG|nr:uncharacterized protein O0I10_003717 [Lichtheimia ornata]KAJ8660669.1 hypothetical protein O0I10_003717 [Lichtheimia ornata]